MMSLDELIDHEPGDVDMMERNSGCQCRHHCTGATCHCGPSCDSCICNSQNTRS